ncbi:hypothetical protein [Pelagibacterium sp.]|uniref:hypothetical protein n=1 Tax=Pelagibacterium sp. TaxID=1967288 RepID=UPI003A8EDC28
MADYRELLRKAIDALPDNTGANRRAVYEKARSALVAQLRAIDPPLPAREITTHRLNLEDCIREVEHEATERLLGRFKAVEETAPEPEPDNAAVVDESVDEPVAAYDAIDDGPYVDEPEPLAEPGPVEDEAFVSQPDGDFAPEPATPEAAEPEVEATERERSSDEQNEASDDDELSHPPSSVFVSSDDHAPAQQDDISAANFEPDAASEPETDKRRLGSIEDIIASAEQAASVSDAYETAPEVEPDDEVVVPFVAEPENDKSSEPEEKHFIVSEVDGQPRSGMPLVDIHGRPLSEAHNAPVASEPAMSSVREVELEPGILAGPEVSDAQVAIDRAIAALDREARGEATGGDEPEQSAAVEDQPTAATEGEGKTRRGFGAFTIFLLISVLLLGGGGLAGYFAWREGFIDLNAVFAQNQTAETTEVAETEIPEDLSATVPSSEVPEAVNTTPDVPGTDGEVNGATMPGEELPFTETETPSTIPGEPEATFEDRLPAEAGTPASPDGDNEDQPGITITTDGPQSLLLEEQAGGAAGAVPYTGSVEWSRGTDELGNPTINAEVSIPARNLDVDVLLRRNADGNLPASHLMEVNFTVAESFVGGSIANLPGVLLKNEELVQGQPLTGASARIVGNSFLFALSSASDLDVENNLNLLENRDWIDLAMVYGTGRRAILTLEKGEDGAAIFDEVLAAWAELDAAAADEAAAGV